MNVNDKEREQTMKKILLGLAATAAIATPLAVAGTASAAPAPKATGSVTWDVGATQGSVVFDARRNKTSSTRLLPDRLDRVATWEVVTLGSYK